MALISMAFLTPETEGHFSLCIFKNAGLSFCPGCGLGHSISYLMHGQLQQSFRVHPLGIPATGILIHRIYTIIKKQLTLFTYEESN